MTTKTKKPAAHEIFYTSQQREEIKNKMCEGQSEVFKARYEALFIDSRSWAIEAPDGSAFAASQDMFNCVTGHKKFGFTPAVNMQIEALKLNVSRLYRPLDHNAKGCNMKALKRFHQFMHALDNVAAPHMGIDTVSTIILLSLDAAGDYPLTLDALFYIGVGKQKSAHSTANMRGVQRSDVLGRIMNFATEKGIDPGTMRSQCSRSIGEDGFLTNIGAVKMTKTGKGKDDCVFTLDRENPLTKRFLEIYNSLSVGQLEDYAENMKLTS